MTTDRRLHDMGLGRRDHTRWLGSSGRYSTRLTLPTTNLIAAWDARAGVTNVSGACLAWADQSGNGVHLLQGTEGRRPTVSTTGGMASLLFDGTDDFLGGTNTDSAGSVRTVYAVVNPTSAGGYRTIVAAGSSPYYACGGFGPYAVYEGVLRNTSLTYATGLQRLSYQWSRVVSGDVRRISFWKNGVAEAPVAITSETFSYTNVRVGAAVNGVTPQWAFQGHILFLAIYSGTRDESVEAYITQEWGV